MAAKKTVRRRANPGAIIFLCAATILLIGAAFFGVKALNTWSQYRAESAITPTPSPTVRNVIVTPDPSRVTPVPEGLPAPTATPSYLTIGSSGDRVTDLQQKLQALGYYNGAIDGQYGSGTQAAVKLFQQQHSLDADGIAGAKTLSLLNSGNARRVTVTEAPKAVDTLAGNMPLLVNRSSPVESGFVPANLTTVKSVMGDLILYDSSTTQGVGEAVNALKRMIEAARRDGLTEWKLAEGYRTYADQLRIFNSNVEKQIDGGKTRSEAVSATRLTVAEAGASEHHTGLAFDLNVPGKFFSDTAQSLWLNEHCWDYGFIIRYTDEKQAITGFLGEEWHVRYVGEAHARRIRELNMCLEEYIDYLKGTD